MWAYLLTGKDEAFEAFKKFRALVEQDSEKKIKVLRSDRGGEFCSRQFLEFCEITGIKRQFTAPYNPQQNGVVERRNCTVVAMIRSCLKEMKMLSTMWGEALRHSVYVLNRLATRSLSNETPYEAWTGKKPDVSYMRVFGCVAYMKESNIHTGKLDDRSRKVVHLGREPGTKAYRLFDPNSGKDLISRDVVFVEDEAWDWSAPCSTNLLQQEAFSVTGFFEPEVEPATPGSGNLNIRGDRTTETEVLET